MFALLSGCVGPTEVEAVAVEATMDVEERRVRLEWADRSENIGRREITVFAEFSNETGERFGGYIAGLQWMKGPTMFTAPASATNAHLRIAGTEEPEFQFALVNGNRDTFYWRLA